MPVFTDQIGNDVLIPAVPTRIVSLVPSQTELLYALGLREEVIGVTKFCVHPDEWFRRKTRIGGTKDLKMELIHQLQPDLIIANKEENNQVQVNELGKYFHVWVSDIHTLEDNYAMIMALGEIVNKKNEAAVLNKQLQENFSALPAPASRVRAAYLIWQNPYMTVGGDTFIHTMLEIAGFKNVFADKMRYPELTLDEIRDIDCLLLSSEPYPFRKQHMEQLQKQLPGTKIVLVDGELFSWYGSRIQYAPAYFASLREMLAGRSQ